MLLNTCLKQLIIYIYIYVNDIIIINCNLNRKFYVHNNDEFLSSVTKVSAPWLSALLRLIINVPIVSILQRCVIKNKDDPVVSRAPKLFVL